MIERVLVPLDGSQIAEFTLPHAVAVARAFRAELLLLRVVGAAQGGGTGDSLEWRLRKAEAEAYLTRVETRLRGRGVAVKVAVATGRASDQVLEIARRQAADLIALSSHGEGGITEHRLGGTAAKVVSSAGRSVLLVTPWTAPALAGVDHPYSRVMVPVDCSKRSEWALRQAAAIARTSTAELLMVHVVPQVEVIARRVDGMEAPELARRLREANRAAAIAYLEERTGQISAPDLTVRYRVVENGHTGRTLQRVAEEENASLVVFSAHGDSAGAEWPYGSVAGMLIAYGSVPLLVLQDLPSKGGVRRVQEGRPLQTVELEVR